MRQEHQNRRVHLARFERTSPSAANKLSSKLEKTSLRTQAFLVAMRLGVTPVPIPNTMVKTQTAEGTALETVWESRWPPNLKEKDRGRSAAEVKNKYWHGWTTIRRANPISRAVL